MAMHAVFRPLCLGLLLLHYRPADWWVRLLHECLVSILYILTVGLLYGVLQIGPSLADGCPLATAHK